MSRYKRISLSLMLGLGAVASVAVIVRIPYVVNLATTHDFLWQTTDVAIWSCVEPGLGLTILNLVVTRPLFRSIFSRFGEVTSAAISRNKGYSSKVSGYGKQSYGASTTMASTNSCLLGAQTLPQAAARLFSRSPPAQSQLPASRQRVGAAFSLPGPPSQDRE